MSTYKLSNEIIANSQSKTWDKAKLEWDLDRIDTLDEPISCLCGHYPIKEECVIKNKFNNKKLSVGNHCVNKFLKNLETNKLFNAIKKLKKDIQRSLNPAMIDYAFNKKWINKWEANFYIDIWRKQNLTDKQLKTKLKINKQIINNFKN